MYETTVYIKWLKINLPWEIGSKKIITCNPKLVQPLSFSWMVWKVKEKYYSSQYNMHKNMNISLTWSKYMILVLLLISEGSWLLLLTAEKATLELAARTEMPSGEDELFQSAGFESQTTRHLPSRTMGSVSFWEKANSNMTARQNKRATQSTNALFKGFMDTMMNDLQCSQNPKRLSRSRHFASAPCSCSFTPNIRPDTSCWFTNHQMRVGGCNNLISIVIFRLLYLLISLCVIDSDSFQLQKICQTSFGEMQVLRGLLATPRKNPLSAHREYYPQCMGNRHFVSILDLRH